jgi:DNA invertase Pin-like site-specific DNA recombinase
LDGLTIQEISKKYRIGTRKIQLLLISEGYILKPSERTRKVLSVKQKKIIRRLHKKKTNTELADQFGVSVRTIYNICKKEKVQDLGLVCKICEKSSEMYDKKLCLNCHSGLKKFSFNKKTLERALYWLASN